MKASEIFNFCEALTVATNAGILIYVFLSEFMVMSDFSKYKYI